MPKPIAPHKNARKGTFRGYLKGPKSKIVWTRFDQARAIMDHHFEFRDIKIDTPMYVFHSIDIVPLLATLTKSDVLSLIARGAFRCDPYFVKARAFYLQQSQLHSSGQPGGYGAAYELDCGSSSNRLWLKKMTKRVSIQDQIAIAEGKRTRRLSAKQRVLRETRYSEAGKIR